MRLLSFVKNLFLQIALLLNCLNNVYIPQSTSFPWLCEFGGAGDEKALAQAGHVTINIPNIWEYFVTWPTLIMCKLQNNKKFKRIKILDVHPVNGKYGDK